jgi:hypothetical protein
MLPWRVTVQRLFEVFRSDPAFRNRLLAFIVVMTLLTGAFVKGVDISVQIGDRGPAQVAAAGQTYVAEDGSIVTDPALAATDENGAPVLSDSPSPSLGSAGSASSTAGRGATATTKPGAAGTAAAAGGAAAPGSFSCDGVQLDATDQGITKDTIKIGFLIPNLNELQAAGFNVGLAGDWDRIIKTWVDELNDSGGVACRKVIFVKAVFDVLQVDDMIAKCKQMTEDEKVFTVFTPGGYDSVAQLCIAKDHKVPFINPEPEPEGWYRDAAPYLWNMLMTKDRMHRNHVKWLLDSGEIKPGDPDAVTNPATRVGVVYHGIPNVAPPVEQTLLPALKKGGVKPVKVVSLSSDSQQALAQINQVVLQFQQARVEYVIMPMNLIYKTQFLQSAEKQNYFPKYTDSDHYFGCFDFTTATYPEKAFDGTKCISSLEINGMRPKDGEAFVNAHPFTQYSDAVYKKHNPDGYDRGGQDDKKTSDTQRGLFIGTGSQIMLWKQAVDRVDPAQLTRPAWGASMGQTGPFDKIPTPHPLSFTAEKWDGADYVSIAQWHAEASDGYEAKKFHRVGEPFKAPV